VDRTIALHHGMVAPQLRQARLGGSGEGNQQKSREDYSARKPWEGHRSPKMPQISVKENRVQKPTALYGS
jgi:hypothetical protein